LAETFKGTFRIPKVTEDGTASIRSKTAKHKILVNKIFSSNLTDQKKQGKKLKKFEEQEPETQTRSNNETLKRKCN
jgi:hypothetical protein